MAKRRKILVIGIAVIGVVLALGTSVGFYQLLHHGDLKMRLFMWGMHARVQRLRVRLLSRTDHKALLAACRELSARKAEGGLRQQRYNVRSDPHPQAKTFPKALLSLNPNYVFVDYDGRITVEMMGGLDHFGVYAYPEGYEKPPHVDILGDKKLIDGLWYYDDGYRVRPQDYDKRIEPLIPKK